MGDITIRANRSLYIDFTLPFTESGVSMIVPIKDNKDKNAWAFLKPLTWDLWVTSGCFFIFIGFVVWVLEHRINEDFRGPPLHQIGTSFWFSFSTMVFAHRKFLQLNPLCMQLCIVIINALYNIDTLCTNQGNILFPYIYIYILYYLVFIFL